MVDVLIDHQWSSDPIEIPEEIRLVVEDLNGMLRRLGFLARHGDLYVLGQEGDLLKMMFVTARLIRQQNGLDGEKYEVESQVRKCLL